MGFFHSSKEKNTCKKKQTIMMTQKVICVIFVNFTEIGGKWCLLAMLKYKQRVKVGYYSP